MGTFLKRGFVLLLATSQIGCSPYVFALFVNTGSDPIVLSARIEKAEYEGSSTKRCPPEVSTLIVDPQTCRSLRCLRGTNSAPPSKYDETSCEVTVEVPPGKGVALGAASMWTMLMDAERVSVSDVRGAQRSYERKDFAFKNEQEGDALGTPTLLVWRYPATQLGASMTD